MAYGGGKWESRAGRARAAGKSKRKRTKTAKRSKRRASAPRARKRKPAERSVRSTRTRRTTKKKQKAVSFYDVNTGKRVTVAKADYAEAYADPELTTKKPKMVYRYNPETGRKVRVAETSEEATAWSSKKPPKGSAGILLRGYQVGGAAGAKLVVEKAAERVIRQSSRRINTAVKSITTKGLAAAGLTSLSAAALIAAGLISYGLASQAFYPQATDALKLDAALKNYLALKRSLATRLGRPLTRDELRQIYQKYQETVVRIRAHDPMINQRPGRE